ncbi:TPA: DNA primase [Candidatus Dependentiae bacterium]|nr:MAG: primase protein [candidate division TM6 bacterium GW2011_GWE2_31_21]KKP53847.1 MAG: primase protein [candidate division TM6 bacterium GW2011_GWF2_33_332]HBS47626.1 DNA primase [Candidatus Dependentiae bacterium]HBZ73775.1 DNA primase [Candidatus Dependentiae bacterium]
MSLFNFLKSNLSILDVVGEYVSLKPAGSYHKGTCPFHSEKDASFTVSPDRGIFYCFGCHCSGDLISFVAKIENMTQLEAAKHLIDHFNITIPQTLEKEFSTTVANQKSEKDRHSYICEAITNWLHQQLLVNKEALNYLTDRQISSKSIETFMVGYFPGGLKSVTNFITAMQSKNVMLKDLLEIGFLSQSGNIYYSPFEERIIFTIRDTLGRFVGFGGRIFKKNDERAKYYNSKESAHFQKGQLLFGFDLAKQKMKQQENAFLVEGYTDCVMMWQHGFENTVATLGTACNHDHLKLLSRFIKTLYVLYDGDKAGQKAILRLVDLCWNANLELKIIHLPEQHDPASFLQGKNDLQPLISNAKDIFEFFLETSTDAFQNKTISEKMEISEKIISVIAKIDNKFKKELLLSQAAATMQISLQTLKEFLRNEGHKRVESKQEENKENDNIPGHFNDIDQLEKKILFAILSKIDLNEPFSIEKELVSQFEMQIRYFLEKIDKVTDLQAGNRFTAFLEKLNTEERDWISYNMMINSDPQISFETFSQLIMQFQKQRWKVAVSNVKNQILAAQKMQDPLKLQELLKKFAYLKEEMKNKGIL